jgi:hypothetical protein
MIRRCLHHLPLGATTLLFSVGAFAGATPKAIAISTIAGGQDALFSVLSEGRQDARLSRLPNGGPASRTETYLLTRDRIRSQTQRHPFKAHRRQHGYGDVARRHSSGQTLTLP